MPLTLNGSGGITYPDGSVNATRSVSTAGDTMTGLLTAPSLNATTGNIGVGITTPTLNSTGRTVHIHTSTNTHWSLLHTTTNESGAGGGDGSIFGQIGLDTFVFNYEAGNVVIGTSAAPRVTIDSAGRTKMPSQPTFEVQGGGAFSPINTYVTLTFSSTHVNIGSHMNNSTGTFTVPVSGVYQFHGRVEYEGSTSDLGNAFLNINGGDAHQFLEYNNRYGGPSFTIFVSLNANDQVRMRIYGSNGMSATTYSHRFGGRLLG